MVPSRRSRAGTLIGVRLQDGDRAATQLVSPRPCLNTGPAATRGPRARGPAVRGRSAALCRAPPGPSAGWPVVPVSPTRSRRHSAARVHHRRARRRGPAPGRAGSRLTRRLAHDHALRQRRRATSAPPVGEEPVPTRHHQAYAGRAHGNYDHTGQTRETDHDRCRGQQEHESRPGQPAPLRATGGPPDRCRRWALCQARADDYELGGHGWPQPRVLAPRPAARSARTTNPPRPPPATSASGADPADRCQPLRRPVAAGSRCQADRLARRAGQMKASWPDEGAQEPQSKEKSVRIAAGPVSRASHPAWLGPSSLTLRYLAVPL